MEIVKIDPNEKYVLVLQDVNVVEAEYVVNALRGFMEDDQVVIAICDYDVTIVPASQVVGYKVLE